MQSQRKYVILDRVAICSQFPLVKKRGCIMQTPLNLCNIILAIYFLADSSADSSIKCANNLISKEVSS